MIVPLSHDLIFKNVKVWKVKVLVAQSCLTLHYSMDCSPRGSSVHGDSPGKNTGVDCHALLQGIIPTQRSNPCLLSLRHILHCLRHLWSPFKYIYVESSVPQARSQKVRGEACTLYWMQKENHKTFRLAHFSKFLPISVYVLEGTKFTATTMHMHILLYIIHILYWICSKIS